MPPAASARRRAVLPPEFIPSWDFISLVLAMLGFIAIMGEGLRRL